MKPLTPEHVEMLKEICRLAETVNKPPAFQFYVQDWLGSSTILAMRPAQEGAYLRLMCCCWDNPKLAIPDDPIKLEMMSRLNSDWEKLGPAVRDCFTQHPVLGPGWLTNVRLIEVRHHQLTKQIQSREANEIKARKSPGGQPDAPPDGHPGGSPGVPPLPGFRASGLPGSRTDELSSSRRNCADDSKSPPPSGTNQPSASRTRTFRERLVDGCLMAFGKRYQKTRGQEYPGGLAALRESGFGVVTKRLKTLCPDVPYRKADENGRTAEQIETACKAALKVWGGYLDRAAAIHEAAKGIPGKDGDWLRFPASIGAFCGRIPKLTDADVDAAGKRAADVAEARKNFKRANPETGSSVRYGDMRRVGE